MMKIVEELRKATELRWLIILMWLNLVLVSRVPATLAAVTVLTCAVTVLTWPLADLIEAVLA
jgi:hypothetical protein